MRYSVSYWCGRLGNNIQQTANCLMLAEVRGHTFSQTLVHDIISKFEYSFGKDGHRVKGRFFNWEQSVNCEKGTLTGRNEIGLNKEYVYANMHRICRNFIRPNLKLKEIEPFDEDTLVIHIRGGDNFHKEFKSPTNYVQNPLSYYLSLIDNFPKVVIVVEPESNNPVVPELKKIKRLKFQSLSVAEDYATLLAAKNLATPGVGTFAISAALCSINIKNIFTSSAYVTEHLNHCMLYNTDVKVNVINLNGYIPVYPCSWKNDATQRRLMIDYQIPKWEYSR